MSMRYFLSLLYLIISTLSLAQSKYVYAEIPDSLKENADYIVWGRFA